MTQEQAIARVKEIILSRFPTQYQAAKSIGKPQAYLYKLLTSPSYNSAFKLAVLFNIPFTISIGE
ncbi:hypothetical protein J3T26_09830 [Salmonella enterica]|uniref:XRE family transcriptional regulator n=3 Tax=Salmonella enterica TaxID=28901 RepID=A0A754D8K2_SALER|nr:helix-turn-helix domain-containing protein [Salmonella enterica]EBG5613162.1 hypothetical protein [Salmonella enterica subsp. enterica serovar Hessarek]EBG6832024.1 hypothetical protein [Salmonella enterica subsp. enterica]EBH8772651.1 hypothetical protein [Salmonella enterica subsp. enterica serovar Lagos]EBW9749001.1 hypothetical protein [Salmonella enterica subsp. enterica serovar Kingston]ECK9403493.1 hypothetical protein [Salmonella enterica subsp. enterica serovar Paratyphi C str. CFS